MGQFAGGIDATPAGPGLSVAMGLSLALPNPAVRDWLHEVHPVGAPYSALILLHHDGSECKTVLTTDLAVVLLGSLEQFWEERLAGLPVDRVDQLQALRADARSRFVGVASHPDSR